METRTVYEFFGCYYHGHTCQTFRDVCTISGETLSDRYESKKARLQQITQAGYQVRVQWECEFDASGIVEQKPELLTQPIVEQCPLKPEMLSMGVEPRSCVSIIKYVRMRLSSMSMS